MFVNLTYILRSQGIGDDDMAENLEMSEERFTSCRNGQEAFSKSERIAIASILGMAESWLFERV